MLRAWRRGEGGQRGQGSEGNKGRGSSARDGSAGGRKGGDRRCDGDVQGRVDVEGRPRRMLRPRRGEGRRSSTCSRSDGSASHGLQTSQGGEGCQDLDRLGNDGWLGSKGRQQPGWRDRQVQGRAVLTRNAPAGRVQRPRRRRKLDVTARSDIGNRGQSTLIDCPRLLFNSPPRIVSSGVSFTVWAAFTRTARCMQPPDHAPGRGRSRSLANAGGEDDV